MNINIGKIIQYFDYYMGLFFLKSPKFFSYTLFDKVLEKNFSKNKSHFIKSFLQNGFYKINSNLSKNVNDIVSLLSLQPDYKLFNKSNYFIITDEIYLEIQEIINIKLKSYLDELELLFRGNIYLTEIDIQRNTENSKMLDANFHVDYYLCNYFKIFINLSDVTIDSGPTEIIPKNFTSDYINYFGYKNVEKPITKNFDLEPPKYIYRNIGKKNEAMLFASSTTLHRAGVPKNSLFRDLLRFTFIVDFQKKKENKNIFYYYDNGNGALMSKYFAKPKNFSQTIKIYNNYKKFSDTRD
jgi:hypothetical protein